jgi:histidinol dehydrogenase
MTAGSIKNHRSREGGAMVYPVYSRRSGGLSVGINLFPDTKVCSFDCPYCEVFPFHTDIRFSLPVMEETLEQVLLQAKEQKIEVKDICFSGNGEPSMSPHFPQAIQAAAALRDRLVSTASLVLITNAAGLLDDSTFALLLEATAGPMALTIWLKLDAGTEAWYKVMNRSAVPFDALIGKIRSFAVQAPFTVQTMICSVNGRAPDPEEATAWERLVLNLSVLPASAAPCRRPSGVRAVHIYGKARPAQEDPLAEALPAAVLEARAASLQQALETSRACCPDGTPVVVEVFP